MFQNNTKDVDTEIPENEKSTKYYNPNHKEKVQLKRWIFYFLKKLRVLRYKIYLEVFFVFSNICTAKDLVKEKVFSWLMRNYIQNDGKLSC